jgi:hypothetical protein
MEWIIVLYNTGKALQPNTHVYNDQERRQGGERAVVDTVSSSPNSGEST